MAGLGIGGFGFVTRTDLVTLENMLDEEYATLYDPIVTCESTALYTGW